MSSKSVRTFVMILASAAFLREGQAGEGPLAPEEAARRMTVPEGFRVTLAASEPDVRQPIAFAIDPRGRLWVAESFSYPIWLQAPKEADRILILEDSDGDGTLDRRKVFWDRGGKVANVSGIGLGFGGVWVCATPNLLFIPDRDGDDVPDGDPEIKLDGWDVKAQHNLFNGLNWGPDGWLYGCNGIMSNSRVGKPGTADDDRVALNCGVWRYHPTRGSFEAFAHGTTNPWGLDFDDYGEAFITNCVIPHLFRVVPGARFQRMYGQDLNPNSYALMESCADHIHWAGGSWQDSREGKGKHGEAGGGHAHVGALIYLGDNWPASYRNSLLTCNLHGRRVNRDLLERAGSGYVARHGRDFLLSSDPWFRGMELKCGPDGSVFLTDWSDTGECHDTDNDRAHRENGRIFKVSYGRPRAAKVDLASLDDDALVTLQLHPNDWYVRNARRILQERAAEGKPMGAIHRRLGEILARNPDVTRKLRALWALHVTRGLPVRTLLEQLDRPEETVRNWAVRLLVDETTPPPAALERFAALARDDPSPLVRLALASALQRLPLSARWRIAEGLTSHDEDARDPTLSLMTWYGVEPLVAEDMPRALELAGHGRIGLVRQFIARRLVVDDDRVARPSVEQKGAATAMGLGLIADRLGREEDPRLQGDLVSGTLEALRGRKSVPMPGGWPAASLRLSRNPQATVREQALMLALLFDDPRALARLKATMEDPSASREERLRALQSLVEKRVPGLAGSLQALLGDPTLRGPALRGLAVFDDKATPGLIVKQYRSFDEAERRDAISTLAARERSSLVLLDALEDGAIPRHDLTAASARQIQGFGNAQISEKLGKVWGSVRPTSKEKDRTLARYKAMLTPERLKSADRSQGRLLFNRACLQCHRLFEVGGEVGPDLTGSDRANIDYVLENILDPGASVGKDYRLTTVATPDGRLISGIVRERAEKTLTIQTVNERIVLPRDEVEDIKVSDASMMPEGALDNLTPDEVRDLVAYLASKSQVPLTSGSPKH